jgi:hypothetical protein
MNTQYPHLVGSTKAAALGKGAGAGSVASAGVLFGTSPWGFQAVCGAIAGMGLIFPAALVAACGYLRYRACVRDAMKIPKGCSYNSSAPAADVELQDGRLFHPSQTTLTEACRSLAGS